MKLVLSTVLAALALPALADVSSSASLTGLRYELVDLAPGDGIAPSIRYTGVSVADSFGLYDFCNESVCQRGQGSFTVPASSSVQIEEHGVRLTVSARASQAGLFTEGQWANGVGIGAGAGHYLAQARFQGVLGQPLFVVSANTAVRITGQYTLDARVNPTEVIGPSHSSYGASAAVFFHSKFLEGSEPLVKIQATQAYPSTQPTFAHEAGELSVLLRNDKNHQATLWGKWGVWSGGQVPIGIPEPSTYALMLAGLGLIGVAVRRRSA